MTEASTASLWGGLDDVLRQIDILRQTTGSAPQLVELLPEQAPIYADRSSGEADRIRGYVLASFEEAGLPSEAEPYLREELETGVRPYTLAAAAKAARGGCDPIPLWLTPLLVDAIERIKFADDFVSFDRNGASVGSTTAVAEIVRTIAWLGPRAQGARERLSTMLRREGCCLSSAVHAEIEKTIAAITLFPPDFGSCCSPGEPVASEAPAARLVLPDIAAIKVQDQDGTILTCGEFLHGSASVVTFFYTRCMNPNKCSLTITKLGRLQQLVRQAELHLRVKIAAFTYDPAFDLPRRLKAYGIDRGMIFDERNRLLRTTADFAEVRACFDLGVGYGSSTVNRHRLELIILDADGCIRSHFAQVNWSEHDVLKALIGSL
jgi:cytochrome oxidase Cu insertion factor (SCO1/SenC/PrrC family)